MDRRSFLKLPVFGSAAGTGWSQGWPGRKKRVAAVVTEYTWYSHADVICGRLLGGYSANNEWRPPRTQLVSVYRAQTPARDMSKDMAARHGFRIYPSIREALTLGGDKLAVDGVLLIAEQGQYPHNDLGQHLYPRYEMFSEILDVYEESGATVPTYYDKHLSYDWLKAKTIFERTRKLGFPFMAGSSVSLTLRKPEVRLPLETPITEVACVGHGDIDAYGFHLLEILQCMVERRKGGETGVREVEMIEGAAIWGWLDGQGGWAKPLLEAAYATDEAHRGVPLKERAKNPVLFRIDYRDGLRGAALMLTPTRIGRTIALRVEGRKEPVSTLFGPPVERPLPHFDGLARCIEEMIVTGKEQYPPERTLMTTGILAHLFESRRTKAPVTTGGLNLSYRAPEDAWHQTS